MSKKIMASNGDPVKPEARAPHILVVDDSFGARQHARAILEAMLCTVAEATHGRDALALMASLRFDLIVTDLEMMPVDGFELIDALSRLPESERPKIIVCSALVGSPSLENRRELSHAVALLEKPLRPEALLATVAKALRWD